MSDFAINGIEKHGFERHASFRGANLSGPQGDSISHELIDKNTDSYIRGKKTKGGHNTPGWFITRPVHVVGKIEEELGGKVPEWIYSRPGVWTGKLIQLAKPLKPVGEVVEVGFGRVPGFVAGLSGLVVGNALQLGGAALRNGIDAILGVKTVPNKAAKGVGKGAKAIATGTAKVVSAPFRAIF